jgi:hypothetical protein
VLIHADDKVVIGILASGNLMSLMPFAVYAVLSKFPASRGIDRLSDFLSTGSRRRYFKFICTASLFHHAAEHILCHRTSAYISVAYEHNFFSHTIWLAPMVLRKQIWLAPMMFGK